MCTSHDTFRHQLETHYSSRPSNPLSASSLAPQIRLWLTIVRIYKLYLLTYLHCDLVITLMFGAKRKERYHEMSVVTK